MRHVKWIFVVLVISSLTSFIGKDKPTGGLNVGDIAPNFSIQSMSSEQSSDLASLRGKYVLLNFWASYDAASRMQNVQLSRVAEQMPEGQVKMVSVSFDEYRSVFDETIKKDGIDPAVSFVELAGEKSPLFKQYRLKRGFKNYLLNPEGVIIAKDVQADELADYIGKKAES